MGVVLAGEVPSLLFVLHAHACSAACTCLPGCCIPHPAIKLRSGPQDVNLI